MTQTAPRPETRSPLPPPRHPRRRPPLLREVYGQLIRRLRSRQGRTLTDVATRAGVSVAYLSEIERGLKEPSSEVVEAVCTALGSSVAHLVGAAHREMVLDSGAHGLAAANLDPTGIVIEDTEVLNETARVLDLTRRHSSRSRVADQSSPDGSSRSREATLLAA